MSRRRYVPGVQHCRLSIRTSPTSFLLKKKSGAGDSAEGDAARPQGSGADGEDDAQAVDEEHGKIAGAHATPEAMQHAKDVALSHQRGRVARSGD